MYTRGGYYLAREIENVIVQRSETNFNRTKRKFFEAIHTNNAENSVRWKSTDLLNKK